MKCRFKVRAVKPYLKWSRAALAVAVREVSVLGYSLIGVSSITSTLSSVVLPQF